MRLPTTEGEAVRWVAGGLAVSAALLAGGIYLATRISKQAFQIARRLDRVAENADGLEDLPKLNLALESLSEQLAAMRTGEPA